MDVDHFLEFVYYFTFSNRCAEIRRIIPCEIVYVIEFLKRGNYDTGSDDV
jgi:hypothetical protein